MKLRILCIIVTLLLLVPLSACNFIAPETDRPFAVNLPESWAGRATVDYLDDGADIVIDGKPMLSLRVVENIPGAREKAEALLADGYWWNYQTENATSKFFFFVKRDESYPKDLNQSDESVLVYPLENDLFELEGFERIGSSGKEKVPFTFYLGVPKDNTYVNHIHGISFVIPEAMREKCWIGLSGNYWLTIYLRTGDSYDLYPMCQFFAFPPGDSLREIYDNQEYYPEVIHHEDGYLYGAINEWQQDIFRGYYYQSYWDNIPLHYRNMITTEEVQQLVDSFTILSDTPDSGN